MSTWPGKTIIGLTGNIATGKSVVRRMLEQLGAFGIDADTLAHRTFAPGAPGYQPVIQAFGRQILGEDGWVDRARLGAVVFAEPQALQRLEAIVHPLVRAGVHNLISRSSQPVIVIEAIKLLESPLRDQCDSLWVAHASPEVQLQRLQQLRGIDPQTAARRIANQPPQAAKQALASILIDTRGDFASTWRQVLQAWQTVSPNPLPAPVELETGVADLRMQPVLPSQVQTVAEVLAARTTDPFLTNADSLLALLTRTSVWMLKHAESVLGIAYWKGDNLIARLTAQPFGFNAASPLALTALLKGGEQLALAAQCEIMLCQLRGEFEQAGIIQNDSTYQALPPGGLSNRLWREAAAEFDPITGAVYFTLLPQPEIFQIPQIAA